MKTLKYVFFYFISASILKIFFLLLWFTNNSLFICFHFWIFPPKYFNCFVCF